MSSRSPFLATELTNMTNQHPIMPPDELVQQWRNSKILLKDALMVAAQWGADQELEACCEWVSKYLPYLGDFPMPEDKLRAARRPKPPSLKEQAHDAYWVLRYGHGGDINETQKWNTIRRALEALPE
jgi:hypothetical protein